MRDYTGTGRLLVDREKMVQWTAVEVHREQHLGRHLRYSVTLAELLDTEHGTDPVLWIARFIHGNVNNRTLAKLDSSQPVHLEFLRRRTVEVVAGNPSPLGRPGSRSVGPSGSQVIR